MKNKQLTFLMIILLFLQAFMSLILIVESQAQTSPDVYVGVDLAYGDVADAKALIDQVSSYTNLIVVGTSRITYNPNRLIDTFQYAYDKGLSFISLTPSIPTTVFNSSSGMSTFSTFNRTEWFKYAKKTWGNRLLGFYEDDEPGGKILDKVRSLAPNASITIDSYVETANQFIDDRSSRLNFVRTRTIDNSGYPLVTSDYGLYWFDYKAGYDAVFAEFGWNYSRQLNIALCRGAATAQNKEWGVMITWTYTQAPYIESGEELYNDMVIAYDNGAKYIMVFDANEGWTQDILGQTQLDAMKRFWNYVQNNPRKSNPVNERIAYILPEAYGFGFRGPNDHIWGLWEADTLSSNISLSVASLLDENEEKLDIVYDDGLQPDNYGYSQLIYWNEYVLPPPKISILSPENTTYTVDNITLTFTINEPTTWIGYSLDGQEQVTVDENITLSNLSEGFHNITLYAKDDFQTLGTSQTVYFKINLPDPPEPSMILVVVVAVVVTILLAVACLLVYFKKYKALSRRRQNSSAMENSDRR